MKRLTLSFLFAFAIAFASGQNPVTVFSEGFESATNDNLPTGWVSTAPTNSGQWSTAENLNVYAYSGDLCATVSYGSNHVANDAWMFSPAITMTAGVTYTITFYVQMEADDYSTYPNFEVKIGTAQTAESMTSVIYPNPEEFYLYWEEVVTTFTPTTTGSYYLGFHDYTSYADAKYSSVDDILITAPAVADAPDAGITAVISPTEGGTANATVTATIQNFGNTTITSMDVAYKLNDGTPVAETYSGNLAAGATTDFTFTTAVDLSAPGSYTLKVYTILTDDVDPDNDTTSASIVYLPDAGITAITSPTQGGDAAATVTATIQNFGNTTITSMGVAYKLNDGTPVIETYSGDLAAGATEEFTFNTAVDVSASGSHTLKVYTILTPDKDNTNDTTTITLPNASGITKLSGANVTLYPNPAIDNVTIENASGARAMIYDLSGRKLLDTKIQHNTETININFLAPGVYFIELQDQQAKATKKLIKQ